MSRFHVGENIALVGALASGLVIGGLSMALFVAAHPVPVPAPQIKLVKVAADCTPPQERAALIYANSVLAREEEHKAAVAASEARAKASEAYEAAMNDPKVISARIKAESAEHIARIKANADAAKASARYRESLFKR